MSKEIKAEMKTAIENDVKAEWMDNWYDGLTYCTWNALGQDLNEGKIYNALEVLKRNNIKSMLESPINLTLRLIRLSHKFDHRRQLAVSRRFCRR